MTRVVKKPEVRRQEIIAAGRKLFLKKDYENTTMQDVMKELNIAKGTTYHYFKSKEELLEAVVHNIVEDYIRSVEKVLVQASGNALEKIRTLVIAGRVSDTQKDTLIDLHRPGNIGMHTRLLAITVSRLAPIYAQLIQEGCVEGLFQTEYPLECAEFFLGSIQFLTDMGCYPWSQNTIVRRTKAFPTFIEKLLNAPKGSFDFLFQF